MGDTETAQMRDGVDKIEARKLSFWDGGSPLDILIS
jgi:hypothetical protein